MPNDVYLVGRHDNTPARRLDKDGQSDTAWEVDILAGASYGIPVLWLFCFDVASIQTYDATELWGETRLVPAPVIATTDARRLLTERTALAERWRGLPEHVAVFAQLLDDSHTFPYLAMELFELDEMSPQSMAADLVAALQWLDRGAAADPVPALLYFDSADSDAPVLAHGYGCGRPVPWDELS